MVRDVGCSSQTYGEGEAFIESDEQPSGQSAMQPAGSRGAVRDQVFPRGSVRREESVPACPAAITLRCRARRGRFVAASHAAIGMYDAVAAAVPHCSAGRPPKRPPRRSARCSCPTQWPVAREL